MFTQGKKMKTTPLYSDLDLSFKPHPLTGDLMPRTNANAIKRSLMTAFEMDKFDIPFDSTKQSNLKRLLFEPVSQTTEISIRKDIEWVFKNMEPRVKLLSVDVDADHLGKGYNITVTYQIKSLMIEDGFTFFAERIR